MVCKCARYKKGDKVTFTETVTGEGVVEYVPGDVAGFDYVNVKLSDGSYVNFDFGGNKMTMETRNENRKIDLDSLKKIYPEVKLGDVYEVASVGRKYVAMKDSMSGRLRFIQLDNTLSRFYTDDFLLVFPDAVKSSLL
jgi:hypothetical protein